MNCMLNFHIYNVKCDFPKKIKILILLFLMAKSNLRFFGKSYLFQLYTEFFFYKGLKRKA